MVVEEEADPSAEAVGWVDLDDSEDVAFFQSRVTGSAAQREEAKAPETEATVSGNQMDNT